MRRAATAQVKIVMMELKSVGSLVGANLDHETKLDVTRTLITCSEKLSMVARFLTPKGKPNGKSDKENANV